MIRINRNISIIVILHFALDLIAQVYTHPNKDISSSFIYRQDTFYIVNNEISKANIYNSTLSINIEDFNEYFYNSKFPIISIDRGLLLVEQLLDDTEIISFKCKPIICQNNFCYCFSTSNKNKYIKLYNINDNSYNIIKTEYSYYTNILSVDGLSFLFEQIIFDQEGADIIDINRFVFNSETNETRNVRLDEIDDNDNYFITTTSYLFDDGSFIQNYKEFYGLKYNPVSILFDESFNKKMCVLTIDNQVLGRNYEEQNTYIFKSFSDKLIEDSVFCVCVDLDMIVSFTNIFEGDLLKFNNNLTLNNMKYLRKMILAKYNYKFKDIKDQAYFNVFHFYNTSEKMEFRLSDVTNLLTPTDKQNLKLIEERIKDLEGN